MTREQVHYGAQVALYTKFLAVRLMQAGEDSSDLAGLFLDLLHAKEGRISGEEFLATPQDAEDLLALVSSGYEPRWATKQTGYLCDPSAAFDPQAALSDLASSAWLWRILRLVRDNRRADAEVFAERFLRLREQVRALSHPVKIARNHATQLLHALDTFIEDLLQNHERTRKNNVIPFNRPRTRRPGTRSLGF